MNRSTDNLIVDEKGKKTYGSKSKSASTGSTKVSLPVDYGSSYNSPNKTHSANEISINCQAELHKLAREQHDSLNDSCCYNCSRLLKSMLKYFTGTVLWFIVFAGTLLLPIVAVIIGSVYFNDCPREWRVPLFLVVGGSTAVCSNLLNLVHRTLKRHLPQSSESQRDAPVTCSMSSRVVGGLTSVLHCFAIAWFFTGCVWVYGAYPREGLKYCKPQVYFMAFWLLNVCFIFFFLVFVTCIVKYVISSLRMQ